MKLHHIGNVVESVQAALETYRKLFDNPEVYGPGVDPVQKAEIAFIRSQDGPWIELLRPTEQGSPLTRAAQKGGGLHHLAFAVPDVREAVLDSRTQGGIVVSQPTPAVAFGGLEVAFVFFRHGQLIEYVDEKAIAPFFQTPELEAPPDG